MAKPAILVVDSDEGFGKMLKEGLNGSGYYHAECAHSGREALRAVLGKSFDLVIVDMGIRDVSPINLVRAIRKAKNSIRVMMIPLMGQQLPESVKTLNINGVLSKPFFVGDLPDLIDQAMGRSNSARIASNSTKKASEPQPTSRQTRTTVDKPKAESTSNEPLPVAATPAIRQETLRYLRANEGKILQLLNDLNREVRAEAILFIAGRELIAQAGLLGREQCRELAGLVAQSSQAAAQAARFLGEKAGRFAQSSHEGVEYRVYTLTLDEGILLSLAISSNIPLGMIRHQCRQTATQLARFI